MIVTLAAYGAVRPPTSVDYSITGLTMREGLSHNFVEDLFLDSRGFMWIATSGSLARYDGYEFVNFTPNTAGRSIKSVFVRKVAEDRFGRLWVASDGGLDVIDLENLEVIAPADRTGQYGRLEKIPSGYVSVSADGTLWLRNQNEIVAVEFDVEGCVARISRMPHNSKSVFINGAVKAVDGETGAVWGSIGGSICRIYRDKGHLRAVPVSTDLSLDSDVHVSDFIAIDDCVWISTDVGLFRYDRRGDYVRAYHSVPGLEGTLSQNFITGLIESPTGDLIASSLNGMNLYDPHSDSFHPFTLNDISRVPHGLNSNFVNCMLKVGNTLWVGTEGCGVGIIHPKRIFATTLRHDPADVTSISPNPVNAIYEDSEGTLWVGTVEGGLNRAAADRSMGFEHFRTPVISHNSVSAITADRSGHLWVGTWGGGLNIVDRANPGAPAKVIRITDDGAHKFDYVGTLAYDPYNNAVWIGANMGIYMYDIASGEVRVPFSGAADARGSVCAVISGEGKLWMGGLDGLYVIDLRRHNGTQFKAERFQYKLDKPESQSTEKVTTLAITHDGTLWVGTNGNGVYRHFMRGGINCFKNISTADGLPNDVAHGIAEDPHGNVWVSTYHGLACMRKDGEIVNYGCDNGLDTEQFYWNASLRLANGDLLFGSIDGLLVVKGIAPDGGVGGGNTVLTYLTSESGKHYNPTDDQRRIPEDEKSFEVAFSSLDFIGGGQGRFYYRMVGFDDNWRELPAGRNSVTYTNLSPGDYSLEVKYVDGGQSLNSAPVASFGIEIVPNFYKRWWFLLLVGMAVLALVWGIYRWRVGDLTRQRNQLRHAVDDGVKEIREQKNLIEEHARELWRQNEELKHRNIQISEQKSQLAEMNRRVQKMTVDRISFFTNITHEFRTPITLIIGPIERALKLSTNPKVIEQLNFVERNSKYLLSLINQLMDFRKVEAGKIEILPTRSDFVRFVDELIPPFRAYAEDRDIEIRTVYHLSSREFSYDQEAIRKVLTNLIGNAIKFTPDHGCVTLYAALFRSARCTYPNTLYLSVSDTGNGIPEEDIDKVFDRFYQGKSQIKYPLIGASDSGIGLYLCRKVMEVYGGSITVRNNRGAGCTFRVLVGVPDEDMPQAPSGEPGALSASPEVEAPRLPDGTRLTVLVVEDNSDMRAFVRSILSDYYDVVEAGGGEEAMRILLSRPIDFIISDLMMPGMDGIELSRQVKENFAISHIPFLMLTAKTANEARLESYRSGVDEYLQKPFDEEILLVRIKNILDNKRRYQRMFSAEMKTDALNMQEESGDKKFVDKVLEVMRDNYKNSYFEVGDFAEALGVSRSLLNKKLSSLLGETPNQFIRTYRLKVAHELLVKNRTSRLMNISEIAFEVGFNDSKYFTRCFTKQYGVSPSSILREDI